MNFGLRHLTILFLIFFIHANKVHSQFRDVKIGLETGILASPTQTPFWHYANTRGLFLPGNQVNHYTSLSAIQPYQGNGWDFSYSYGAQMVTRFSDGANDAYPEQLFAAIRYRGMQLQVGRYHRTIGEGMKLTDLSTGSMIQSTNATPIPKIEVSTVGYRPVPFTRGFMEFKARYADGILDQDRVVESPYLHQKSLYVKFNVENFMVTAGVIHNVVWAGKHADRGRLPQTFDDYMRIVLSKSADPESIARPSEINNRLGNTVAAYDFSASYTFHNTRAVFLRHIYLEDTIGAANWRSLWDGTYGAGLQRVEGSGLVNSFFYEVMFNIRHDSKSILHPQGRANYYNHTVYRTGWAYRGSAIGNPLLTYDPDSQRFTNNMVIGHHIGVSGDITPKLNYRFFVTYTRNYGVCTDQLINSTRCFVRDSRADGFPENLDFIPYTELIKHQFSYLIDTSYVLNADLGIKLNSSVAIDVGEFHGNRIGFLLGISFEDLYAFRR